MQPRTPLTIITGPLGSGKTTLLRHILSAVPARIAILMNEFGEIAIDSKIIEGKNVRIAELGGGCVCCSLLGEFEAAVQEVIEKAQPELVVLETTGVAEPDALIFNVQETLPHVRLDGIVAVADADGLTSYPELGRATRRQIEEADLILLNKVDLVSPEALAKAREKLSGINGSAPVLETERCEVDPELLFGIGRERDFAPPTQVHHPEFESFSYVSSKVFSQTCFEQFASQLKNSAYRAKGFVRFSAGACLFNFVSGRWDLEPSPQEESALVFIGERGKLRQDWIFNELKKCEQ